MTTQLMWKLAEFMYEYQQTVDNSGKIKSIKWARLPKRTKDIYLTLALDAVLGKSVDSNLISNHTTITAKLAWMILLN
jgi:hypothetical protein